MSLNELELQNLAFLASMSALGLACASGTDDSSNTFGTSPTMTGMANPMGDQDTGDDGNGDDDNGDDGNGDDNRDDGADAPADDGADAPADEGPADDGMTDGNPMDDAGTDEGGEVDVGGTGGEAGVLCQSYADVVGGCYDYQPMEVQGLALYCEDMLYEGAAFDPACGAALEEWLACVNVQQCRALFEPCDAIDTSSCPDPEETTGAGGGGG
ncbi:MAG: hypothetical protein AAF721_10020 [Myxococcota bacterium]